MRAATQGFVLTLLLGGVLHADPPREDDPLACGIPAILLEDDAGLRHVYDGVRKGLELAQLPRVCLETVDAPEAFAEFARRLEAQPPPVVFAIGRKAAQRIEEAGIRTPRVYVDLALGIGDEALPAALDPEPPAALIRAVVSAARWGEVLRGLRPSEERPRVRLDLAIPPDARIDTAGVTEAFAAAAGIDVVPGADGLPLLALSATGPRPVGTSLLRPGLPGGPGRPRLVPVLSDDIALWGQGAVVVLTPDHRLLGRVAAEAARRLIRERPAEVLRETVLATELRVDLAAAEAAGFDVPLEFVAGADVVRRPTRRSPGR